ncbi:hypothetical protein QYF61_006976 [Mycteria americana]|uniref:Uncharacterized protein n=1 Tax=Mycteria americana TaxID=33587 RepID=A0AAN7RGP6_MYCAM|nr:hypothetical protein QYF61_006976 [Mycteria americana]
MAEGYGKCIGCVQHSIEKPTAPGSCCHVDTSSAAQQGPVVQRFADGQITIVCHYCEERILCCGQEEEEKDLCSTSCIGDGPGVPQGIGHGFGDSGGDGAQVKNREVEEEEVHGGVEAVVAGYRSDDEAIAQEGSQVDAQEEPEVQEMQLPPCVHERELEDLGDFTEELVQGIAMAEGYGKCIGCVQHSIEKPTAPGSCCHVDTSSAAQQGPVVQRFADGQITIVCHYCEERILCCGQEEEEKDLCSTSCIGDGPGVPQGIGHGFGDSGGDGAQVKNREVEEEEVHGGVEAVVAGYSGDDEAIAQEGSQVDAQEEPEVQEMQLPPCVHERQEEELGDGAAVGHLLSLCKGPGQGGKGSDK